MIIDYVIYVCIIIFLAYMSMYDLKHKSILMLHIFIITALILMQSVWKDDWTLFVIVALSYIMYSILDMCMVSENSGFLGTRVDKYLLWILTFEVALVTSNVVSIYFILNVFVIAALYSMWYAASAKLLKKEYTGIGFIPCLFICFVYSVLTQSMLGYQFLSF